ncbi:MAG: hypothetical protein WDN31_23195 [Hyphomicrobium sp.]
MPEESKIERNYGGKDAAQEQYCRALAGLGGIVSAADSGTGMAVATTAAAISGLSSSENFRRSPALS